MTAVWLRFRADLRSRWKSWAALAALVALSAAVVLTVVAGARRSDSAYERLVAFTNAHDVIVFGNVEGDLDKVAALPEVADAAPLAYVLLSERGSNGSLVTSPLVSMDGGFFGRIDRPKVLEGRRPDPTRPHEIAISPSLAHSRGLDVGSTLTMTGYSPEQAEEIFAGTGFPDPGGPTVDLLVVGIEVIAGEGELIAASQTEGNLHLTPAFARTYGATMAMTPLLAVTLRGGAADLTRFRTAVERISGGRPVQINSQAEDGTKPQRSIHLQAVAMWVFAGLAASTALMALGQALARQVSIGAADNPTLRALGMSRGQLWAVAMLRAATIGLLGAAAAAVGSAAASPLMPMGLARLAEPAPGISVDWLVLGLGMLVVLLLAAVVTAWPAWRAAGAAPVGAVGTTASRRARVAERLGAAGLPPSAVAGVRLATDPGRGPISVPVRSAVLGIALSLAATTTVVMFGASLDKLLSTPRLYGWNWDMTVGNPYVDDVAEQVVPVLDGFPGVSGFSAVATADLDIAGARTLALGFDDVRGSVFPPILNGRAPRQPDEVALGATTMEAAGRQLGQLMDIRVGDTVSTVRIVGQAVFPSLAAFEVKRPGDGVLFTIEGLRRLVPGASQNVFPVRLAPGADDDATMSALDRALNGLGVLQPAAPVEVGDFGRIDNMPAVLTGLLALMATAIMAHTLITTVRRRRRDLAVLKMLGFVRSQVRATVAWQATSLTAMALLVGLPLGVVAGRAGWRLFAGELGIVPAPVVPVPALLLAAPVTLLLANLVAAVPASSAARARPVVGLRAD